MGMMYERSGGGGTGRVGRELLIMIKLTGGVVGGWRAWRGSAGMEVGCRRSAEEDCRGDSRERSRKHVLGHGWGRQAGDGTGLEHGEKSRQKRRQW